MKEQVDLLIAPDWIIPIEPAEQVLVDHAVVVHEGRIVNIDSQKSCGERYDARNSYRLPGHVLIPGLVNLHTHAAMTLLRGYADDLALMDWLQKRIWPAEAHHASFEFVLHGTTLACAEMVRGGITCFNDMYFFPEAAAEAASTVGIRAALGIIVVEFPTAYATDAEDYLRKGLALRDAIDNPLISFCIAPHAPYTVSDQSFGRIATLSEQLELPIHIHLHETRREVEESLTSYGERPIDRLRRLGLLGPGLVAVHGVHLTENDRIQCADNGCSIAHCPSSNMKLGSGIAPIAELAAQGVRVGLGTDGAASNNRLDLFQEMRQAALLAKVSGDATALRAHDVLRMATLNGAAALGLDKFIGSIEPGKDADLCAVNLSGWQVAPCYDPASHLIYVASRDLVSHVWIRGDLVVEEGHVLHIHNKRLLDATHLWQNRLEF